MACANGLVMAGALCLQAGTVEIDGFLRCASEADELIIRRRVVYLPAEPWLSPKWWAFAWGYLLLATL